MRTFSVSIIGFIVCLALSQPSAGNQPEFVPLFDGKTLDGWHTLPGGNWEFKDGVLIGTSKKSEKRHKPGQWNQMTVSAHRRHIVVHLNGVKISELKDDPGRLEGHLALQLHGNTDMHVEFKDVEILIPR